MTPTVTVFCGDFEIFHTGTIILQFGQIFTLKLDKELVDYSIEFSFVTTDNFGISQIVTQNASPTKIVLRAENFNNSLLVANSAPIYVANSRGKKVMMSFASALLGAHETSVRVIHYQLGFGGPA